MIRVSWKEIEGIAALLIVVALLIYGIYLGLGQMDPLAR